MKTDSIFAKPKIVNDVKDCYFYHTLDVPGYGTIEGNWDLRGGFSEYLGTVDFKGKKVLEMGTANGALCFEMERRGASVIAFDLSKEYAWDIIPHPKRNFAGIVNARKKQTDRLNNAFWFCHRRFNSRAKVVYGTCYNIPEEIGPVDIVTFGAFLLHVRDPFLALQVGLKFACETVIITELLRNDVNIKKSGEPSMKFLPDPKTELQHNMWWSFEPNIIVNMIGLLGFENVKVNYHIQNFSGNKKKCLRL